LLYEKEGGAAPLNLMELNLVADLRLTGCAATGGAVRAVLATPAPRNVIRARDGEESWLPLLVGEGPPPPKPSREGGPCYCGSRGAHTGAAAAPVPACAAAAAPVHPRFGAPQREVGTGIASIQMPCSHPHQPSRDGVRSSNRDVGGPERGQRRWGR